MMIIKLDYDILSASSFLILVVTKQTMNID